MALLRDAKADLIKQYRRRYRLGYPEVQIAVLTNRITYPRRFKTHKKDHHSAGGSASSDVGGGCWTSSASMTRVIDGH